MKNIKRILCAVLCLCMITGTLLTLVSCDKGENTAPAATESDVTVVIVAQNIEKGTVITKEMLKVETVKVSNVHLNAIKDIDRIVGKVAAQNFYVGEYVFASKLTDKADVHTESSNNLIVTEHIEVGGDITTALQALIDNKDNYGRTIEFPDGEYVISKPIVIPADTTKAVSLRLSDYAVIKAADSWNSDGAMIQMASGKREAGNPIKRFKLEGGKIDCNGKAKAISIENALDIMVAHVEIVNAVVGVEIVAGAADIENIVISGNGKAESVGLVVGGDDCSAANIRISNVANGVVVTGKSNALKSVFATYSGSAENSCGFYDMGEGSRFDVCTSQQFSEAFKSAENTNSIFYDCLVKWSNGNSGKHWAFVADKQFNSLIRNCKVEFGFADCNSSFLVVGEEGGSGTIVYPMISGEQYMVGTDYENYLVNYADDENPVVSSNK